MNAYKSHIVRLLLMALLVLPAMTSCYDVGDECEVLQNSDNVNYINVTVAVSTSNSPMTRANTPQGGEDGDGHEKGIDTRENYVNGVTLIFYQDATGTTAGINATNANAENTTIDYVAYYSVERDNSTNAATHHKADEVYYTTGDQKLSASFRVDKKYHMLVVANANLTGQITTGVTTLAQVRDMTLQTVYAGTGFSTDASAFIMSSEEDHVVDFTTADYDNAVHRRTLRLDRIHIERMAARIDFLANNGTYTTGEYYIGALMLNIPVNGYVYNVGSNDHFVLTRIVPFNLNMGAINATGNEYLFKRTDDASNPYLADDTTDNWVVDPYTSQKLSTQTSHFAWTTNPLTNVETQMSSPSNVVTLNSITLASPAIQAVKQSVSGTDNFIIAYPKENTLKDGSLLYYNATGIAFEGYYFYNGLHTAGVKRVYYHYLRHQGESSSSYQAMQSPLSKDAVCGSSPAMNFGVVRNNIYRVEISSLTDEELKLKIKVKKWDKFEHDVIYM